MYLLEPKVGGGAQSVWLFYWSNHLCYTAPAAADESPVTRVSFETSFDSKQPKLEPKLVSALSETKRLFRLFRFYTETASFGVSIEPKQPEDQPKQTETNENGSGIRDSR